MDTNTTIIIVAVIIALVIGGFLYVFRKRLTVEGEKVGFGRIKIEGSNEPLAAKSDAAASQPGAAQASVIKAKDVISEEAGVTARHNAGGGIEADGILAKKDVLLEVNPEKPSDPGKKA